MSNNFKVIVAGGGPAGLVAAHSLHLAGIDFTVLEQRDDIVLDQGASLVLKPDSLRVLHQFGLFDRLREIGSEIEHNVAYSSDGYQFGETSSFKYMKENHGCAPVAFHRAQLVETIYNGLPDEAKARVLTGKKIADVSSDNDGVRVTCVDGSIYEGSVLIGADGVHSRTRRQMRKIALEANPDAEWDAESPYTSQYKCMWCSFPVPTAHGEASETHHKDRSVMYLSGKTRGWIFLYEKLPHPSQERVSYTEQDILAYADSFADYPITADLKVKDVFAKRFTAGMSTLEEGVAQHWSWGRIALVGDACHKYTPNAGLGLNNGIQDVVALCNGLRAAVYTTPSGSPDLDILGHVFEEYQNQRQELAVADCSQSARITRMHADANLIYFVVGHYIMWLKWVQYLLVKLLAPRSTRKAFVLDYVTAEEPLKGAVSWVHSMAAGRSSDSKKLE